MAVPQIDRKDLSYDGMSERRRQGLLNNITNINEDLKYEGYKVTLQVKGKNVNIRYAVAPGKWKDRSPKDVEMSAHGIETARRLAFKIGNAVRDGLYTEDWYQSEIIGKMPDSAKPLTWQAVIAGFPDLWLKYRSGDTTSTDRQKAVSLKRYTVQLRLMDERHPLEPDTIFDGKAINTLLALDPEGTDKRFRLRETLSIVCTIYNISFNFKNIGKRPKPARREIPSDELILATYKSFEGILAHPRSNDATVLGYRWLFAVLASYGLRPQELFAIDLDKSFRADKSYWLCLDESLTDGLKTGDRWVAPIFADWVQLFDLPNAMYPPLKSDALSRKVSAISDYFRSHKFPLTPYSLRHAYAIRGRILGIELMDMAASMGHDIAMHVKIYQRWIGVDERIKSIESALTRNR
ncbi:hypothetical protein [Chamaesiphon sp.]|uniref:hypothetical protein n=1 Tax=Chamaesiphon sp. TaxID=2814140 RepID=UPI0035942396